MQRTTTLELTEGYCQGRTLHICEIRSGDQLIGRVSSGSMPQLRRSILTVLHGNGLRMQDCEPIIDSR